MIACDDRDLIECFNLIYELYPAEPLRPGGSDVLSLVESRDVLRLFSEIGDPELRTAVRMLLRTLAAAPSTSCGPSDPPPSAANTRG